MSSLNILKGNMRDVTNDYFGNLVIGSIIHRLDRVIW